MENYSTSTGFADDRLRASPRPIAVASRRRVTPAWALRTGMGSLPAAIFPYKLAATLAGISILITVGPMSPCVSTCSRIFSNKAALLTSPRIASENSFRIIASSRYARRTCRPSRYSTSSDRTLRMMFAISVESRFPRPFGFGHTPFLNRV